MNPLIQLFVWFTLLAVVLRSLEIFNLFALPWFLYVCFMVYVWQPARRDVRWLYNEVIDRWHEHRWGRVCRYCERRVAVWLPTKQGTHSPLCAVHWEEVRLIREAIEATNNG